MTKRKRPSSTTVATMRDGEGEEVDMKNMDVDQMFAWVGSLVEDGGESREAESEKDEEEVETEEEEDVPKKSTMREHKLELAKLRKKDPEFYQFLEEHDKDLLVFGEDDDEEEEEGEDDDDGDKGEDDEDQDLDEEQVEDEDIRAAKEDEGPLLITRDSVRELESSLKGRPRTAFNAARKLLRAFRCGCQLTESVNKKKKKSRKQAREDEDDDQEGAEGIGEGESFGEDIKFSSPSVYQRVMTVSVLRLLSFLSRAAGRKDGASANWTPPISGPRWKKVQPLVRSFTASFLALVDGITDGGTTRFLLKRAELLLPLLTAMPKLAKQLISVTITIWASESVNPPTRLRAYLLVLNAATNFPEHYHEMVLKLAVQSYRTEVGRHCSLRQLPQLKFCVDAITDICAVDLSKTYALAFVYIREIAIALRGALVSKGKEELDKVYNWEVMNSLRLWSAVLSKFPKEDELRPLIYPYVQVTMGIMRLVPATRNYGLRFHCVRFLGDLMKSSGVYIPLASALLEAISCREVVKAVNEKMPKQRGGQGDRGRKKKKQRRERDGQSSVQMTKPIVWRTTLRVPEASLPTRSFRDGVVTQSLYLLAMHLSSLSRSVCFPELAFPTLSALRRFAKEVKVVEYSKKAKELVRAAESDSQSIRRLRAKLDFGAKGAADFSCVESPLKFPGRETDLEHLHEVLGRLIKQDEVLQDDGIVDQAPKRRDTDEDDDNDDDDDDGEEKDDGAMEAAAERPLLLSSGKDSETNGVEMDEDDEDTVEALLLSDDDDDDEDGDATIDDE